MPIYTYRCENCGVQFDRHQSFNDEPLKRCPECNKNKLRKVYTPAGIVFKGSGWYATDHRSPSGQTSTSTTKSETTATKKNEGKKGETVKSESTSSSTEK